MASIATRSSAPPPTVQLAARPPIPGFLGAPPPFGMLRCECDRCSMHVITDRIDAAKGRCWNCGSFGLTPVPP
jgi:hypothetical protein